MKFFTGITLVDVTATGVVRHTVEHELQRNQQRNWETVLQCIGIKAQPQLIETSCQEFEIDEHGSHVFGEMYQGPQRVWLFSFGVEHDDVFLIDHDPVAGLNQVFEQVPIICGLQETARFLSVRCN